MSLLDKPGVYDISAEEYHKDPAPRPSLSASGIVKLLPVPFGGCPAKFQHDRLHGEPPKRHFDFGHVAHRLVLGKGEDFVVLGFDNYKTKAAQAERDAVYADGKTPILAPEYQVAEDMVATLRAHPFAGACFENITAERTCIWEDEEFGVWCRIRPDAIPNAGTVFADYKTAASVADEDIERALFYHGGFVRAALYTEGLRATGVCESPTYVFVFQEKDPPYLVRVVQPTPIAVEWGAIVARRGKAVFRRCLASGVWPGYDDDVVAIGLPGYAEKMLQAKHEAGAFDDAIAFQKPLQAAE